MFNKLKDFFTSGATLEVNNEGEPTNRDLIIATGVLLLETAGVDEDFAPEEVQTCFRTMEKQFQITDTETLEIMESAQAALESQGKIDTFVAALNQHFTEKQRQIVLAMVWRVVMADSLVERYEQHFAEQLRQRLKLTEDQAEQAKTLALEGRV